MFGCFGFLIGAMFLVVGAVNYWLLPGVRPEFWVSPLFAATPEVWRASTRFMGKAMAAAGLWVWSALIAASVAGIEASEEVVATVSMVGLLAAGGASGFYAWLMVVRTDAAGK